MHQTLYRKYRPQTFDEVVGQDHITSVLKYEVENSKVSHAYLFCGSRGTGKTSCAKILAKAVNCLNPINGNPCCKCEACKAIDEGNATDVIEMDAASNNGVDYIRDIRSEVNFTPAMMAKKVYIIDEVHMLSTGAFNALLKTLEEPPAHVLFILATTELHKLPATIISRCQRFDFRRITLENISSRLKYIASKEDVEIDDISCAQIAKQAQGGMRDAISLFELCSSGGNKVTPERIIDILGVSGYELMHKTMSSIINNDMPKLLGIVSDIVSSSKDLTVFADELLSFLRDILVSKYATNPSEYLDLTQNEASLLKDIVSKIKLPTTLYYIKILDNALDKMNRTPQNKRIILELAFVKMADASLEDSYDALNARISALEDKLTAIKLGNFVEEKAISSNTKAKDETKKEEKPIAPKVEAKIDKGELLIDIGLLVEKADKGIASYLKKADIFINKEYNLITIETSDNFFPSYASTPSIHNSIMSAFMMAGLANNKPTINVIYNKDQKKEDFSNELFNEN